MAVSVAGFRLGMIASGAGSLILVGQFGLSWPEACRVVALVMSVGLVGVWLAPEPRAQPVQNHWMKPLPLLWRNYLFAAVAWWFFSLPLVYKLPEHVANAMSLPFLLKLGLPKEQVGTVREGLGVAMTIFGTFVGGGVVSRAGLWRSLLIFGRCIRSAISSFSRWPKQEEVMAAWSRRCARRTFASA